MSGYACSDILLASVALLSALSHPITYDSYAQGLGKIDGFVLISNSLKLHYFAFLLLKKVLGARKKRATRKRQSLVYHAEPRT
jgi:hypothetical protein